MTDIAQNWQKRLIFIVVSLLRIRNLKERREKIKIKINSSLYGKLSCSKKTHNYARQSGGQGSHFSFSCYEDSIMSIIDPLACEFAKIFYYNTFANKNTFKKDPFENLTCYKSQLVHLHDNAFLSTLNLCSQSVTYDQFKENFKKII